MKNDDIKTVRAFISQIKSGNMSGFEVGDSELEAVVGGVSDGTEPLNPNDIRYYDFVRINNYKCRSCGRKNPTALVTELIER